MSSVHFFSEHPRSELGMSYKRDIQNMQFSSSSRIENHCCRNTIDVHFVTLFRLRWPAIHPGGIRVCYLKPCDSCESISSSLLVVLGCDGMHNIALSKRRDVSSVSRAHKLSVSRLCLKPPPSSQRATAAREQFESAIMRSRGEYGKAAPCVYSWQQNRRYMYAFRHRVCCSSQAAGASRGDAIVAQRCRVWTRCFLSALLSP